MFSYSFVSFSSTVRTNLRPPDEAFNFQHCHRCQHLLHRHASLLGDVVGEHGHLAVQQSQHHDLVPRQSLRIAPDVNDRQRSGLFLFLRLFRAPDGRIIAASVGRQRLPVPMQLMGIAVLVFPQNVPALHGKTCAVAQETITAAAALRAQSAWQSKHVPPLLRGRSSGNKGAALFRCLYHQCSQAQAAENAVAGRKAPSGGLRPRRILR